MTTYDKIERKVLDMKTLNNIVLFSREDICNLFGVGAENGQNLFYSDEFPAIKVRKELVCRRKCFNSLFTRTTHFN